MRWISLALLTLAVLVMTPQASRAVTTGQDGLQILLPAANFECLDGSWFVREHPGGFGRPLDKVLAGRPREGTAIGHLHVPKAGRYTLWVRYLASRDERGPFEASLSQDGAEVGQKVIDTQKHPDVADHRAAYVWDHLPVDLEAGDASITVRQVQPLTRSAYVRVIDVFVLTPAPGSTPGSAPGSANQAITPPNIRAFMPPIYMQVRMDPSTPRPVTIHLFGRHSYRPWWIPHSNIGHDGLTLGTSKGTHAANQLAPGQTSPWVNITPLLAQRGINRLRITAIERYNIGVDGAAYEVTLSTTESEEGLLTRFERSGPGSGILVTIDQADLTDIRTEIQWSQESRTTAEDLPAVPGRRPRLFPLLTTVALTRQVNTVQAIENEAVVMEALGINTLAQDSALADTPGIVRYRQSMSMGSRQMLEKSMGAPDHERVRRDVEDLARSMQAADEAGKPVVYVNMADEPSATSIANLAASETSRQAFIAYLKSKGFTPQDLGAKAWEDLRPTDSRDHAQLYVQSALFRSQAMADFYRTATDALREHRPDHAPTTVNFANELVYGANLLQRGADWFTILRTGALGYGWTEDWCNHLTTFQFSGYLADVMRSACKTHGQAFGLYNILRHPWEVQVKTASEVGRGAKAIHYFNYGPYYAISSDQRSQRHALYPALHRVNYAIGAVEEHLYPATVAPARVALLLSHSTEIWNLNHRYSVPGKERMHLWLIARHLNEPVDVLTEDDLVAGDLSGYQALLVAESHIQKESAQAIAGWVRQGGMLVVTAGAAQRDRLDQPLSLLADLGVQAAAMDAPTSPGRDIFELPKLPELQVVRVGSLTLPVVSGMQHYTPARAADGQLLARFSDGKPAAIRVRSGKGQVVAMGFFPGLSYGHVATQASAKARQDGSVPAEVFRTPQTDHYPEAARQLLAEALKPLGPAGITSSQPLVQADLLHGPEADVLVLGNWTGRPLDHVTLDLRGRWLPQQIQAIAADKNMTITPTADGLRLTLPIEATEFIVLPRAAASP